MQQRQFTALTHQLVENGIFNSSDMFIVDIGAARGYHKRWNQFGKALRVLGIEPDVDEVNKLNTKNQNPKVDYLAAFVASPFHENLVVKSFDPESGEQNKHFNNNMDAFARSSAWKGRKFLPGYNENSQSETQPNMTDKTIILDQHFKDQLDKVNFLKVDTDGKDLEVLMGSSNLLQQPNLIGLEVECQFHGPVSLHANTFSNIDHYLRKHGFSLYDMRLCRYSRMDLPRVFEMKQMAQTQEGQLLWADCVYFRDYGDPKYKEYWRVNPDSETLLKLACTLENYCLEDVAAELLNTHRDQLNQKVDVDMCLDMLTPMVNNDRISYKDYINIFKQNPEAFYPAT